MQNEIIQVIGYQILRQIASNIKAAGRFSIMVDETTDVSTKEQVVFALRWIDDNWSVHEDLIGLSQTDSIDSNPLVCIIRDILIRLDLKLENCRGKCYDGASNMRRCQKRCSNLKYKRKALCHLHPLLWTFTQPCLSRCYPQHNSVEECVE
jgi:hypothetical protein